MSHDHDEKDAKGERQAFEANYANNSKISIESYHERFVTLPCECGDGGCPGWAAIGRNPLSILTHMRLSMGLYEELKSADEAQQTMAAQAGTARIESHSRKLTVDIMRMTCAVLLLVAARHLGNDFLLGLGVAAALGVVDMPLYSKLLWRSKNGDSS